MSSAPVIVSVFALTLGATFLAAAYGGWRERKLAANRLADQNLNRWLVGLSAGATANSGFIVTGAVGLGYGYGMQWILLPLAWFLGDIVYWALFPSRINDFGRTSNASTLPELLRHGFSGRMATVVSVLTGLVVVACLGGYTSAQWLAGQKFLSGAFPLSQAASLFLFAFLIIAYTGIGGFRGSVYADSVQAVIRIVGTVLALAAVIWVAADNGEAFQREIGAAGPKFQELLPGSWATTLGFVSGFAAAAVGFGLGQPQLISRYLAGRSPEETKSAWWIYIGFVQFTWISMTLFGVILRGVMPGIDDPEAGLSVFFTQEIGSVATGIIVADVFATIAATTNSLLITMAQSVRHDILPAFSKREIKTHDLTALTLILGAGTVGISLVLDGTVMSIALASISYMGAGLAAPVLIKVMRWNHTDRSLILCMVLGLVSAYLWKYYGMHTVFNESGIGLAVGLSVNWIFAARR